MNSVFLNGFYMATDITIGGWSGTPSSEQLNNANIIRSFFINEGWTINAICGMLGNMQGESTINPAFIQATNRYRLPNSAANLSDVPNSVMINFYKEYYHDSRKAYAIGLVQWDGYSTKNGVQGQKLVNYADSNNIIWFDGWTQMYRIRGEQQYDVQNNTTSFFTPVRYSGVTYTFANYPYSTASCETLAKAWAAGYERNAGGPGYRPTNARWFYDYFTGPDAPDIIQPEDFLLPLPNDPDDPPFDPDDPNPPDPSGSNLAVWIMFTMANKRKELKRRCLKI
jgi:hypothetical protein